MDYVPTAQYTFHSKSAISTKLPRSFQLLFIGNREIPLTQDEADSDWRDVPGAGGEACRYQYDHSEKGEN